MPRAVFLCRSGGLLNFSSCFKLGLVAFLAYAAGVTALDAQEATVPEGPIAYIGHGAMFDSEGREIEPTPEFLARAQAFYRDALLDLADDDQRTEFRALESEILRVVPEARAAESDVGPAIDALLTRWLIDAVEPMEADRLLGKVNVIEMQIQNLQGDPAPASLRERLDLPSELLQRLEQETSEPASEGPSATLVTGAGGAAYREQCRANGVPVPPDWGTSGWVRRGVLDNEFISAGLQAEVFTFQSSSPEGVCIALPRFQGDSIRLLGVICLGRQSSKACYWDNQENGGTFFPDRGEVVPFSRFGGGADLVGSVGGVCTECHAGENPYIIHPGTALGLPTLNGLPLFANGWHDPIVQSGWPQNPGPLTMTGECSGCHTAGGVGGRFPQVSSQLRGYCNSVLRNAVARTMPPGAPGSQQNAAQVRALLDLCDRPPPPPPPVAWTGAIWQSTGVPCSGESCPGWQRLDNNPRTTSIVAARSHLYQLHSDGAIWRSTGSPCSGESCPGWRRLDNNPRTIAIAAGGDALYQLHIDGAIWRFTGTPCSGSSCPGWQRLDNNPRSIAIAAGGSALYQLHNDGSIWRSMGTPCSGESCPGWQRLDNNPRTVEIIAAGTDLYQLHVDGRIWQHTGTACTGNNCPGWRMLDNNPRTVDISANGTTLLQRHRDGAIWRFTGRACSDQSCPGWERLDNNPRSVALAGGRYQMHQDGRIWRGTGQACSGESCPGWQALDNNPRTRLAVAAEGDDARLFQLHAPALYQLHDSGAIWQSEGRPCSGNSCPSWQRLDNNPRSVEIAASAGRLYQRHRDGRIWQSTGHPCVGESCPGWRMLDNNPATRSIASGGGRLYQLHADGRIWRSTGQACSGQSCPGWVMLDNNRSTVAIAAGGGQLYQLHRNGRIWRSTGHACSGQSCPGWVMLDNNPRTKAIATSAGRLYQLHNDGRIWRHNGRACSGESCPDWTLLDNNPRTRAIFAGGGELYQMHEDGTIWEATGVACTANSCPGWRRLDANRASKVLAASDGLLFQLHSDGQVWRSDGRACQGNSCPGWQRLDNNRRTIAIEADRD